MLPLKTRRIICKPVGNNLRKLIQILSFLILITFLSCGQNSSEKILNGKWYEIQNEKIIWNFYQDSLIITADPYDKVEWKANDSKIEFDYPTFYWDSLGKPINFVDKIVIEYKLSDNRDTISGKLTNRKGNHKFGLIRTEL